MYKLREARLKEFYNSGEISKTQQHSSETTTSSKSCNTRQVVDSLNDHSFQSMKSKEIRDSESPTKDIHHGWNIITKNETSNDGKTLTTTKSASTSGTELIQGGKIDYAAKGEMKDFIYQEGDDKNFNKSTGTTSSSIIQQEAKGGDDNHKFSSKSNKSTTSTKYHSEQHSEEPSIVPPPQTKVIKETHTLPDGTIVTKTKYETTSQSSSKSTAKSSFSTQEHSHYDQSKSVKYQSSTPQTTIEYYEEVPQSLKKQETTSTSKNIDSSISKSSTCSAHHQAAHIQSHIDDTKFITVPQQQQQTIEIEVVPHSSTSHEISSKSINIERTSGSTAKSTSKITEQHFEDIRSTQEPVSIQIIPKTIEPSKDFIPQSRNETITKSSHDINVSKSNTQDVNVSSSSTHQHHKYSDDSKIIRHEIIPENVTSTTTTTITKHIEEVPTTTTIKRTDDSKISDKSTTIKHDVNQQFITLEQDRELKTRQQQIPEQRAPTPERPIIKQTEPLPQRSTETKQPSPERRQPIKPTKSELDEKSQPTTGQYDTTYRTDYTNKKISVDLSASHQAFASSLRSVTPDRIRSSQPSLRTSVSPEKSPRKTVSTETITKTDNLRRRTDNRRTTTSSTIKNTEFDSSTLTKKEKI